MPLYDRKCNTCDAIFEVVCKISEKENTHECPECESVDGCWHLGAPAVAKRKSVKISPRWLRMSLLYQHFSRDWSHLCDYSRQAQEDAYLFDSLGQRPPPQERINGFIIGKQWMGVTVDMWKEDLPKGLILRRELYEDPNYPHWWLDQVLPP